MLFLLDTFSQNPEAAFAILAAISVALVTGIAFHEYCHAWSAYELGDATAARQGRLTLNPLKHLDPLGTALLFIVGFGWGKPTPVNPGNLRTGPRRGNAIVAFAGPMSNFVFAVLAGLPLKLGLVDVPLSLDDIENANGQEILGLFLFFVAYYNVLLGIFNLIPIHPLDGFKVLLGLLPRDIARQLAVLEPYGPGILMTLFVVGFVAPQYSPIRWVFDTFGDRVFDYIT
jgi:Zn-dependent protease